MRFNGITYFTFENSTDQYQRECDEDERADEENCARGGTTRMRTTSFWSAAISSAMRTIHHCLSAAFSTGVRLKIDRPIISRESESFPYDGKELRSENRSSGIDKDRVARVSRGPATAGSAKPAKLRGDTIREVQIPATESSKRVSGCGTRPSAGEQSRSVLSFFLSFFFLFFSSSRSRRTLLFSRPFNILFYAPLLRQTPPLTSPDRIFVL